ncbi:MAG: hypothetical protein ACK4MX_09495 [Thermaurantiacus sp.]
MMFAQGFQSYVCPGDVISCEAGPFTVLAQIVPDDCPDAPDQRQDGFWPSLYANAPGFIGPGNNFRQRFAEAQALAEAVMEGWRKGDWFYCGIVLSVSLEGVDLARTAAALYGIEANYPGTDNSYLTDIANELLPEAVAAARETLARLVSHVDTLEGA